MFNLKLTLNILRNNEACANREMYRSKYASNIVGTFKNGSFSGPAKVTFQDGTKLISEFKNGSPAGFSRKFNKDGSLIEVFYENIVQKGYKWIDLHPKYLFYTGD